MNMSINFAIILCLATIFVGSSAERVVCYYGSWSVYRNGPAKFEVSNINPKLCTHLIYSFVGLNEDGTVKLLDPWNDIGDDWKEGAFKKLQKLRPLNPNLKIIAAIGGWNEGSTKYSQVVNDPKKRKVLVNSILDFTLKYKFDGFDLDWEYPNQRGGQKSDREAFSALIAEIQHVYKSRGLTLSAAVSGNNLNNPDSYECEALAKHLDFMNILSYDLHGSWEKQAGHHTALYPHPKDPEGERHLNVQAAVEYWVNCTKTPSKVNIGIAFYGRTFTLADPNNHGIGAPTVGPGPPGKYVPESGILGYNEICMEQKQGLWKVHEVPEQGVIYALKDRVWVGYDDVNAITKKLEFAKSLKLGGASIWSIETDDFRGDCGKGKYELLNHVNKILNSNGQKPEPTQSSLVPSSTTNMPTTGTTDLPPSNMTTPRPGPTEDYDSLCQFCGHIFKHPKDPNSFFMCTYSGHGKDLRAVLMKCPSGLVFDDDNKVCAFPKN